ncbi:tyrosine-type recombinase/integrase [Lysobacter arvi]|uniref:Integrase arm-type DNA-binding domain-containing protein n=1 Tax=Lysobacter arvi TaxID=3038776 RepID=A0ABU1CH27_9GAMM|nr:integrase arm-type DNA-binding domain-containing protein [Lysobacter arvi]MDR0184265.1 integrase arm-type DNA-binding domain-containing protein [Lysobacter arvi]
MLSDAGIRRIKCTGKVQRHTDGGCIYLETSPAGGKWWRWKYRFVGKEKRLSFGVYPDVGLAEARGRRGAARRQLTAGIDLGEQRRAEKGATVERTGNTFGAVAREWWVKREKEIVTGTAKREQRLLETYLLPYVGQLPIADITAPILLAALRKPEAAGKVETAHRARSLAGQVFRYAIATGRAARNPAADLAGALATRKGEHFASVTEPAEIGPLLMQAWADYLDSLRLSANVCRCVVPGKPIEFLAARKIPAHRQSCGTRMGQWPTS